MFFKTCKDGVHKYKPRYNLVAPKWMEGMMKMRGCGSSITDAYEKQYVCDICVRCGKVVRYI